LNVGGVEPDRGTDPGLSNVLCQFSDTAQSMSEY
jgi:hypothetical protein